MLFIVSVIKNYERYKCAMEDLKCNNNTEVNNVPKTFITKT